MNQESSILPEDAKFAILPPQNENSCTTSFYVEGKIARSNIMICRLCASEKVEKFKSSKNRDLYRCLSCNVLFVKKPSDPERDLILETGNRFFEEYLDHEELFKGYFKDKLSTIEKYKDRGDLLDVGCGIGTFLRLAKNNGWKVLGIDLSASSVSYAIQSGLDIENARIESLNNYSNKFDVITIFQTIEHMEDPLNVLVKARTMLKTGGILVVTTPNRESLLGRILGKRWFGYYNEEHLFFFDKKSFEFMIRKAGFEITSVKVDSGKELTFSWVFTRIGDYYYNHRKVAQTSINFVKPLTKYFGWIKLKEPMVDLIAIARTD